MSRFLPSKAAASFWAHVSASSTTTKHHEKTDSRVVWRRPMSKGETRDTHDYVQRLMEMSERDCASSSLTLSQRTARSSQSSNGSSLPLVKLCDPDEPPRRLSSFSEHQEQSGYMRPRPRPLGSLSSLSL
mmetsp:Transcript_8269/g.14822  ORF Transcript_8269/g.14822 Transcript_8269/m.14822 type:complete len:130 (+) Transcript_8269:76-465(+)